MFSEEVSRSILLFSSNRELARRQLGSVSKHWLHVHCQYAWHNLVLDAVEDDCTDAILELHESLEPHATVQKFASAPPSLQKEIAKATRHLTLIIVNPIALTAHHKAFAKSTFDSVESLVIHGSIPKGEEPDRSELDELRWGIIFSSMLATVRSIMITDLDWVETTEDFWEKFITSFWHLHTIDIPCFELSLGQHDAFPFELLESCQGFEVDPELPSESWLTRASKLQRLAVPFLEGVTPAQIKEFFSLLSVACPKLQGLKLSCVLDVELVADLFYHLPEGLKILVLQIDENIKLDGVLYDRHQIESGSLRNIQERLRQWVRPQCCLKVCNDLWIETLEDCFGDKPRPTVVTDDKLRHRRVTDTDAHAPSPWVLFGQDVRDDGSLNGLDLFDRARTLQRLWNNLTDEARQAYHTRAEQAGWSVPPLRGHL